MAIGEEIFPEGCGVFYQDGKLHPLGQLFMEEQRLNEWQKRGAEHPCYGCDEPVCVVRTVEYHDEMKRYVVGPEIPVL